MLSIIIPVLNDADALRVCLATVSAMRPAGLVYEVVVVDGGECRRSRAVCSEYSARYLQSRPGRGAQMNAGAEQARGDWFWFLHADSRVQADALSALAECISGGDHCWGAFRYRVDHPSPLARVIEWSVQLRCRLAALPYGDQGIFVEKSCFHCVGGYAETAILEDVMLCEALVRKTRPCLLGTPLITSARRMQQLGIVRTTLINWRVMWRYYRGSRDFDDLRSLYRQ